MMNVFENLIDELKEENLLEETVIESQVKPDDEYLGEMREDSPLTERFDLEIESSVSEDVSEKIDNRASEITFDDLLDDEPQVDDAENILPANQSVKVENVSEENVADNLLILGNSELPDEIVNPQMFPAAEDVEKKDNLDEKEFYRKRAVEEVSGLQMVEHVLSGVEREQMKTAPKNFNDIAAKKALHDFLQVLTDVKSPEHAQAEFQLMQETETWCSALSHRDKRISVAHLRRYCETTKPALSSQALISLARFYRNLPYSESVRGKFDFVVTKLFTKDDGNEKRVLVFSREELIRHLKDLYAEWSSISLYAVEDDDSSIVLAALKFEDLMNECDSAENFDELVKTDFFNRLRSFKESTEEVFFAPLVTAAAIECNARIGNRFVDLIRAERTKDSVEDLQEKYGFMHDQTISDATSKTLQLVELLKVKTAKSPVKTENQNNSERQTTTQSAQHKADRDLSTKITSSSDKSLKTETERQKGNLLQKKRFSIWAVNKWLLVLTILVIVANAGLYAYVNFNGTPVSDSTKVKKVNLENTSLQEFLKSGRISNETFYGVTSSGWNGLPNEKKEEVLRKITSFGADKGFRKVHLLDKDGKTVGFASPEKVEVITP